MENINVKVDGFEGKYNFEIYPNTTEIEIGDYFIFSFCGIWDVQKCPNEDFQSEINPHDRPYNHNVIDLVHGFWRNCYKIKSTNFDLTQVD